MHTGFIGLLTDIFTNVLFILEIRNLSITFHCFRESNNVDNNSGLSCHGLCQRVITLTDCVFSLHIP